MNMIIKISNNLKAGLIVFIVIAAFVLAVFTIFSSAGCSSEKSEVEKGVKKQLEVDSEKKEEFPKTVLVVPDGATVEKRENPLGFTMLTSVYCGEDQHPCGTWEGRYSLYMIAFSIAFNESGTRAEYKLWVTNPETRKYEVKEEGVFPTKKYRDTYGKSQKCNPPWFLYLQSILSNWKGVEGYLSFSILEDFPDINVDGTPEYMPSLDSGYADYDKELYLVENGCGRFLGKIFGKEISFSKKKKGGLPASIKTTSTEGQTQVRTYLLQDGVYICDNVRVDSGTFPCD